MEWLSCSLAEQDCGGLGRVTGASCGMEGMGSDAASTHSSP